MTIENQALEVNDRFYKAFNQQNFELMLRIWHRDASSVCVHPGWNVLRGFNPIMNSWKAIFDGSENMEIKLSHVKVDVAEDLAWVNCEENLFTFTLEGIQTSNIYATNLYKRVEEEWKIVLHHASALPPKPEDDH